MSDWDHVPAWAAEFPNDNPSLHEGVSWVCLSVRGPAKPVARPRPLAGGRLRSPASGLLLSVPACETATSAPESAVLAAPALSSAPDAPAPSPEPRAALSDEVLGVLLERLDLELTPEVPRADDVLDIDASDLLDFDSPNAVEPCAAAPAFAAAAFVFDGGDALEATANERVVETSPEADVGERAEPVDSAACPTETDVALQAEPVDAVASAPEADSGVDAEPIEAVDAVASAMDMDVSVEADLVEAVAHATETDAGVEAAPAEAVAPVVEAPPEPARAVSPVVVERHAADSPAVPSVEARAESDAYAAFVEALVSVLLAAGATRAGAVLPGLLDAGALDDGLLDGDSVRTLAAAKVIDQSSGRIVTTPEFVATARAWKDVLRGLSSDLSACGTSTLDGWAADLLRAFGVGRDGKMDVRRELRRRGVAAFGMLDAA